MTINELLKKANEIRNELCIKHEVEISQIEDLDDLLMFAKEGLMHRAHHHKYNKKRNKHAASIGLHRSMTYLSIDGNVKQIADVERERVSVSLTNKE